MTYEELIEETGAEIGIEGFTPDEDGVCILASDIGEIVIMDCKDAARELVLGLDGVEGYLIYTAEDGAMTEWASPGFTLTK